MRIFITGDTGNIGQYVCKALLAAGTSWSTTSGSEDALGVNLNIKPRA